MSVVEKQQRGQWFGKVKRYIV